MIVFGMWLGDGRPNLLFVSAGLVFMKVRRPQSSTQFLGDGRPYAPWRETSRPAAPSGKPVFFFFKAAGSQ